MKPVDKDIRTKMKKLEWIKPPNFDAEISQSLIEYELWKDLKTYIMTPITNMIFVRGFHVVHMQLQQDLGYPWATR